MKRGCFAFILLLFAEQLLAAQGYGALAKGVMGPLGAIITMLRAVCIMTGVGLILGGMVKFGEYRRNSDHVTISVPISMWIAGLALIGLGFIPMLGN